MHLWLLSGLLQPRNANCAWYLIIRLLGHAHVVRALITTLFGVGREALIARSQDKRHDTGEQVILASSDTEMGFVQLLTLIIVVGHVGATGTRHSVVKEVWKF